MHSDIDPESENVCLRVDWNVGLVSNIILPPKWIVRSSALWQRWLARLFMLCESTRSGMVLLLPIDMPNVGAQSTTVRRELASPADELPSSDPYTAARRLRQSTIVQ